MKLIALLPLLFFSCVKDTTTEQPTAKLPTLQTTAVNSITATAAISEGLINLDGGSLITERGFCYSTTPSPTTANTTIISGSGRGSAGTGYGNEMSFSTTVVTNPGAGVTFNGHTYSTIVLGNGQEWMAENLRTTSYANGDPIPNKISDVSWQNSVSGAWSHYQNNSQYDSTYGKLYNWYAVADGRNICPTGWHVPLDAEWTALTTYLGGTSVAGGKMKSTGTRYWLGPNQNATNESGFSALPGGARADDGSFDHLILGPIRSAGTWWSGGAGVSRTRKLRHDSGGVGVGNYAYTVGFCVRCIKD
jgi:uncharacterized protein (TIGR02145 family)